MPLTLCHAHAWQLSPEQAVEVQNRLRTRVIIEPLPAVIHTVGGVDVSFRADKARAALALLAYPALQPIGSAVAEVPLSFPYIPGLLSFRELPAVLAALEQLDRLPDVLMVDGQGIAHPRRFGIASHLGVLLDRPSIGVAKSPLIGSYAPPAETVGSTAEVYHAGEVIGVALRTRLRSKPLIISVGHRADLPGAVQLVMACTRGYRLPEPTRLAHRLAAWPADEAAQARLFGAPT